MLTNYHPFRSHTKRIDFSQSCTLHTPDTRRPQRLQAKEPLRANDVHDVGETSCLSIAIADLAQQSLAAKSIVMHDCTRYKSHGSVPHFPRVSCLLGQQKPSHSQVFERYHWSARTWNVRCPVCSFWAYSYSLFSPCARRAILDQLQAPKPPPSISHKTVMLLELRRSLGSQVLTVHQTPALDVVISASNNSFP